jgi:hypothetical protein
MLRNEMKLFDADREMLKDVIEGLNFSESNGMMRHR